MADVVKNTSERIARSRETSRLPSGGHGTSVLTTAAISSDDKKFCRSKASTVAAHASGVQPSFGKGHFMKIQTFFETVYRPQRLLGKSVHTTRLYEISIRKFGRFVGTEPTLDDLTNENLIGLMQSQLDGGRSPATANKDRNQLLTLWRHSHRLGMIDRWPIVPELIEPERTPEAWLADDLRKLMATIDRQDGFFGPAPRSRFLRKTP